MRPSLLNDTIKARFTNGIPRPLYIIGSPGLGKTQIVRQVAEELDVGFMTIHAPLMQPEDLGMPVVNAKRDGVKFVVPTEKFPIVGSDCPEQGILLIDELPQADNAIQKTLANLMQEREIHGQYLKEGWLIVATGNRAKDRAGANRILSHLMNRMTKVEFEPHLDDWCNWYMEQPDCKVEGLSFLRFKPSLLSNFDPQQDVNPTPRAWVEGVFSSLGNIPAEAEMEVFAGDVGEGAASEFKAFLQIYRQLPNPDSVLMNPDTHAVPTEPAVQYALAGAIAHRATKDNFDRVMIFAKRMPPEFTVIVVKDAVKRDNKISSTKAFIQWAQKEGAAILS